MNKFFLNKFIIILLIILCFSTLIFSVNAEESTNNYKITILDEADLLSDKEEKLLKYDMYDILEFGNAAFISVDYNSSTAEDLAIKKYREIFGQDSGIIFLIDMDNRVVYIYTDGYIHRYVNDARAYEITANIYEYATDKEYYLCAQAAYDQVVKLLNNELILSPMRLITSILAGISVSLLLCIFIAYIQRKTDVEIVDMTQNKETFNVKTNLVMTKQQKSSRGSSSSGGGGGGGGGGGHSF